MEETYVDQDKLKELRDNIQWTIDHFKEHTSIELREIRRQDVADYPDYESVGWKLEIPKNVDCYRWFLMLFM